MNSSSCLNAQVVLLPLYTTSLSNPFPVHIRQMNQEIISGRRGFILTTQEYRPSMWLFRLFSWLFTFQHILIKKPYPSSQSGWVSSHHLNHHIDISIEHTRWEGKGNSRRDITSKGGSEMMQEDPGCGQVPNLPRLERKRNMDGGFIERADKKSAGRGGRHPQENSLLMGLLCGQ